MHNPMRFIWVWLIALIVLTAAVGVLNGMTDPYDVFGSSRIAGFNRFKPEARDHAMMTKTYQIERAAPVTVLIGSSRVHIGIDSSDPTWPQAMRPVFNYAIPGYYAAYASLLSLREAVATGHVKHVLVFLDFQNFLAPEPIPAEPGEDARRLLTAADGTANPFRSAQIADDMFLALFTMRATVDSVSTIVAQSGGVVLDLPRDGSSTEADFVNAVRTDGAYTLFSQKETFEAVRARGLAKSMSTWTGPIPNLEIVGRMIAVCRDNGIDLTLAIAPSHADALELYWRHGLWPRVEQLKTELTDLVAKEGGGRVKLWDFSGYDEYTTEPVPPAGNLHVQTHWFWESTHFRKPFGHLILQRMYGPIETGIGVPLTPDTVAIRNAEVRAARQRLVCDDRAKLLTAMPDPPPDGCPR